MQKFIPVDKLARPENHILVPLEDIQQARIDQKLLPFNAMPYEDDFLKGRLHGICAGEFQAMEAAGRSLFDFPDAPWEFQLDMARQVWDESRHAEIYMKLLEYVGSYLGEFPETEVLWSCTSVDDVLADEITHVRMGSKWMRKLTEGDPERLAKAQMFQDNIDNLFNFQGGRTTQEDARQIDLKVGSKEVAFDASLTIAKDARLLAGFTQEEIDRMVKGMAKSAAY